MNTIGWLGAAGSLLVLMACGGGGDLLGESGGAGSAGPAVQIRGVVARGGALVEAKVTARCAAGPAVSAISGSSGAYAMEVGEDALPCVLEAVSADGAWRLHSVVPAPEEASPSAAARPRTAHITPLTELLVAQLAGVAPSSFMVKASTRALGATITPTNITQAHGAVGRVLQLMGVNPAPITDVLAQPLVAASAVQRGNAHDKVLAALAAAMEGAGAKMSDLVGLVTSRARTLDQTSRASAAQRSG
ncbi:hypothetical protein [Sphaerotilus sp.]|uniref:hypothetical protein n=1 Tax=Sphaerotilus sp. TaxID=2093942 RepID=UPI002ACE4A70|nr:hypothetical protein [Sphaerotilus sp.]MDZ7856180.1 hypothetical protein [Sphaerotilus sp.]